MDIVVRILVARAVWRRDVATVGVAVYMPPKGGTYQMVDKAFVKNVVVTCVD